MRSGPSCHSRQLSPRGASAPGSATRAPRRVLLISLFHPELVRGGAQQVCYELFQGLRDVDGIEPVLLASVDANYPALHKAGARITGFDGRPDEYLFLSSEYDYVWHKTNAPLLVEAFADFLDLVRPEVVHFHHFLTFGIDLVTLTRRVLPTARIVFTFHEFMSICSANGHMVRTTDQSLCTQASPVRCHQCFPDRTPEHFLLRKMWFQRHLLEADAFTCPSRFMMKHFVDWGLPAGKIVHVTNGQRNYAEVASDRVRAGPRNRFAFFGQMVDVKGVQIILRAVELLRDHGFTSLSVELNGDNLRYASPAIREEVTTFLAAEAGRPSNARIVVDNGSYQVDQLRTRMDRVDWCLVPSIWWEIFGLVISEAWMFGKPVLCSDVGGPAERITHEVNGLHFAMGDPRALADAIRRACEEDGLWTRLHANLPPPPSRETMVEGYLQVYRGPAAPKASPVGTERARRTAAVPEPVSQ